MVSGSQILSRVKMFDLKILFFGHKTGKSFEKKTRDFCRGDLFSI
jgi:hypothetical protein